MDPLERYSPNSADDCSANIDTSNEDKCAPIIQPPNCNGIDQSGEDLEEIDPFLIYEEELGTYRFRDQKPTKEYVAESVTMPHIPNGHGKSTGGSQ